MSLKDSVAVYCGKLVSFISRTFRLGAGATWPGEVSLMISPNILEVLSTRFSKGIILVVGTNGKTTTTSMIAKILAQERLTVVYNVSGANLLNGIVSAIVTKSGTSFDYGLFEVDENSLPIVMRYVNPRSVIVLNLFRDQLDRYGEVDVIAEKWHKTLRMLRPDASLILNADDPLVASFGKNQDARVSYFGLSEQFKQDRAVDHATDSIFCQFCGGRLAYTSYYFSHLGDWYCTVCGEKRPDVTLSSWDSPLPGLYNTYNTLAAVLAARELGIPDDRITSALAGFTPAFGRQEEFEVVSASSSKAGIPKVTKKIKLFLSKNPAGFNASLRATLDLNPEAVLIALNDRIPDGRDVSWIWDVDFEMIPDGVGIVVSGDRVYDMALRIRYTHTADIAGDTDRVTVEPDLKAAVRQGLGKIKSGGTLYVLATYSAMLDVRKIITGRKIL